MLAPDFVINSGGAIYFIGREVLHWSPAQVADRVQDIDTTLTQVYERAGADDVSTDTAAQALARSRTVLAVAGPAAAGDPGAHDQRLTSTAPAAPLY